ncbi:DUF5684 domain-containing protein [Paenibacillus sp. 481]|uniref:DUF5684 domain-containing protein n=1 Tax=Paenibacillus sp. 481 TaxID=2835869 RepID=UPI001E4B9E5C|nr:DUF5684 domain-containing protein [Paenibacillus sp. 481]UHA71670.1 hypothetical protein KIK04_12735 [Paenibacillus sp. 481]
MDDQLTGIFALGLGIFGIFIWLGLYILGVLPFYMLAKKARHEHSWFAFVPILNLVQMLQVAKINLWLIILIFIPVLNFFFGLYVLYKYLQAFGHGIGGIILSIIPVVNIIYWYYIAISSSVSYELEIGPSTDPYSGHRHPTHHA